MYPLEFNFYYSFTFFPLYPFSFLLFLRLTAFPPSVVSSSKLDYLLAKYFWQSANIFSADMCQLPGFFSLLVCFFLNLFIPPSPWFMYCKFQLDFYCGESNIPYVADKLESSFIPRSQKDQGQSQESDHHLNLGANWAEKSLLVPLNFILSTLGEPKR